MDKLEMIAELKRLAAINKDSVNSKILLDAAKIISAGIYAMSTYLPQPFNPVNLEKEHPRYGKSF